MAKVSIIMSCFNRANLLQYGLASIQKQQYNHDLEVVVVNDGLQDNTESVCKIFNNSLNIKYIYAGQRHNKELVPRNPCFANNIAYKNSSGEIILLTCPEIYQIGSSVIETLVSPLLKDKSILSIPKTLFDDTGYIIKLLKEGYSIEETLNASKKLRTQGTSKLIKYGTEKTALPYLMGFWRNHFEEIGGYDEDFTGIACEDNDLIDRFKLKGLDYKVTESEIIHLYHPKVFIKSNDRKQYKKNARLLRKKRHIITRNINKQWGII